MEQKDQTRNVGVISCPRCVVAAPVAAADTCFQRRAVRQQSPTNLTRPTVLVRKPPRVKPFVFFVCGSPAEVVGVWELAGRREGPWPVVFMRVGSGRKRKQSKSSYATTASSP